MPKLAFAGEGATHRGLRDVGILYRRMGIRVGYPQGVCRQKPTTKGSL